jgi:hypothetical protein
MTPDPEDFAAKLTLIEWEAKLLLEELSPGAIRDRIQHIATVARLLRLQLDLSPPEARSDVVPAKAGTPFRK